METGLERRQGLSRPPEAGWTLAGSRRSRAGRQDGLTMSDIMEGNIQLDSDGEEEMPRNQQEKGDTTRPRGREETVLERQRNREEVVCYN